MTEEDDSALDTPAEEVADPQLIHPGEEGMPARQQLQRLYVCRYGTGCTHLNDKEHRDQFWHPTVPKLDSHTLRTHYICNECGKAYLHLTDLQNHLQRKTSWTNRSLVGSRVNCFLDAREWKEGVVTEYHRNGKHHVHFYVVGEKRWLNMMKILFYIIDPAEDDQASLLGEAKQGDADNTNHDEDKWMFWEHISLDYAFTQSVLFKIYGSAIQETGYRTKGHLSLTDQDKKYAKANKGSFLYGELLPRGVEKALRDNRLNCASARTLFDLGMGIGKIIIQAFLQYRNLVYVYGVELSRGRYRMAEEAALRMVNLLGKDGFSVDHVPGVSLIITEIDGGMNTDKIIAESNKRVLHLMQGDLLDTKHICFADIIMLETDFPENLIPQLCYVLTKMKSGAKCLTYLDLKKVWAAGNAHFKQLEINKSHTDRYSTSWSVQRGHHFFLWRKQTDSNIDPNFDFEAYNQVNDDLVSHELEIIAGIHPSNLSSPEGSPKKGSLGEALTSGNFVTRFFGRVLSYFRQEDRGSKVTPIDDVPESRHSRGHIEEVPLIYNTDSLKNNQSVPDSSDYQNPSVSVESILKAT